MTDENRNRIRAISYDIVDYLLNETINSFEDLLNFINFLEYAIEETDEFYSTLFNGNLPEDIKDFQFTVPGMVVAICMCDDKKEALSIFREGISMYAKSFLKNDFQTEKSITMNTVVLLVKLVALHKNKFPIISEVHFSNQPYLEFLSDLKEIGMLEPDKKDILQTILDSTAHFIIQLS